MPLTHADASHDVAGRLRGTVTPATPRTARTIASRQVAAPHDGAAVTEGCDAGGILPATLGTRP